MNNVSLQQFAESFGTSVSKLPKECLDYINSHNFNYYRLPKIERDNLILAVLRRIEEDTQKIGSAERTQTWENGWAFNLQNFKNTNYDYNSLIPKFIRPNQAIRFMGDYIIPENPNFEYDYMTVFRIWLFKKYFNDIKYVHEFGCGTGLNLVLLDTISPGKELHGLDFVQSSVDLINEIQKVKKINIQGHLFNMLYPDSNYQIKDNSAVFTFGAIEQLASNIDSMIEFLLQKKPKMIIHIEPTIELYNANNLFDHLAIKFHQKRGYTEGLLPKIQELDSSGKAKLIKVKRLNFGSLFMEGYSYYVWKPI